jgi:hypothetical protein
VKKGITLSPAMVRHSKTTRDQARLLSRLFLEQRHYAIAAYKPHLAGMLRHFFHGAEGVYAFLSGEFRPCAADGVCAAERARGAQYAEAVETARLGAETLQRALHPLDVGRGRGGELRRPQERHLGTVMARNRRVVFGVGRADHRVEYAAVARRGDGIGHQRMGPQPPCILIGHAL